MQYIFPEPNNYSFQDLNGHDGKLFGTKSPKTNHLIIECKDKLSVSLIQAKSEFSYYVIEGAGYFVINDDKQSVKRGDLIVIPPGTKYSFGGQLKMLLINTPRWSETQETVIK